MTFNGPEERLHAPQVQLPHQIPDDVVDGEDPEVTLKPPQNEESSSPRDLTSLGGSSISHTTGLLDFLTEREVGRVEVPGLCPGVTFTFPD